MSRTLQGLLATAAWLLAGAANAQASADETAAPPAGGEGARRVVVVDLHYSDAFEVAELLTRVVPPTIRVVPYGPTNSLVISGPAELMEMPAEGQ